jgi:ketosteroid isomerase-like protein
MTDRSIAAQLLHELHAARMAGSLERLCAVLAPDATLRIAGTSDGKPIAIAASGAAEIRTWLSMLVKAFRLSDYELETLVIEGTHLAAHWRVDIHSKVTGVSVDTELVDLIEVRGGRIASLTEFFLPC